MRIEENKPLAALTTLGVGGAARWWTRAAQEADVVEAVDWAGARGVPIFVLGGGSNLVVADAGFDGLVLHIALDGVVSRIGENSLRIFEAGAGCAWDAFVDRAVDEDCAGIECLAGIPGTVGGTPVQNVGAYGQEVSNVIESVRAFDLSTHAFVDLAAKDCGFAYRRSRFSAEDRGRFIVTRVSYRLEKYGSPTLRYVELQRAFDGKPAPTLREVSESVRRIRQSKGMLLVQGDPDCRSAGSFFKNPVVSAAQARVVAERAGSEPPRFAASGRAEGEELVKIPAAWLIEHAGFRKGFVRGAAGISSRHTLALVNRGEASAADILALAAEIQDAVRQHFSVMLEMEPVRVGFEAELSGNAR